MATFNEINDLRKSGAIDEAYIKAKEELMVRPDDLWIKRAMAWVLYDQIKLQPDIRKTLKEIVDLNLDASNEKMFFDALVWAVAKNIAMLNKCTQYISEVFCLLKNVCFSSSAGYSYLFKMFHRFRAEWPDYISFCQWWDFGKFCPDDYQKYKTPEGQMVMAVAEQAYVGYSKALLVKGDAEMIFDFLPRLKALATEHPDYQYPPYFLAKLYQKVGDKKSATDMLLPFVRRKSNDYWVWQTLGDIADDESTRFSCYSMALTCRCKLEFLVSIKEQYAQMLLGRRMYSEAKTEFAQVADIRRKQGWGISNALLAVATQPWYLSAQMLANNEACYNKYKAKAEELVLSDFRCVEVMVVGLNNVKHIANYVSADKSSGMFLYPHSMKKSICVGNVYRIYCAEISDNGFLKAAKVVAVGNNDAWNKLTIRFDAVIMIPENRKYGIVKSGKGNIFVPSQMLSGVQTGDSVSGSAVASYDKKMNRDGWTAFSITKKQ